MAMPLEGIKVIDLTIWMQAFGTSMLADLGAEVIKVEDFPKGDPIRGMEVLRVGFNVPETPVNFFLEVTSRGKKSLAISLRQPEAREVISRLVKGADVFVSNLREKALKEWGLDYPQLKQVNPRIIYARDSAWGRLGPDKDLPGMDVAVQARGGLMSMMGDGEGAPPPWGLQGIADKVGALQLAYGIVTALLVRERTGIGQEIHVSMLGGQLTMGALFLLQYLVTGQEPISSNHYRLPNPLRNTFPSRDGKYLSFNLTQADRHWPGLCRALGLEHLIHDPRFNSMEKRRENSQELVAILDRAFATRDREEWVRILPEYGLVFGPVQTYAEVARDPQVQANDYIVTINHPAVGPMKVVGNPIWFSQTPGEVRTSAPEFGQHTEEVLLAAGYVWEEIQRLKEKGVII